MTCPIPMSRCARCGVLYAVAVGHGCVRDVNAHGLGDRRGAAVERLDVPRYRPGTLDPIEPRQLWRVYVDGRPRLTTDRESEARGVARLIADGGGDPRGLAAPKPNNEGSTR